MYRFTVLISGDYPDQNRQMIGECLADKGGRHHATVADGGFFSRLLQPGPGPFRQPGVLLADIADGCALVARTK